MISDWWFAGGFSKGQSEGQIRWGQARKFIYYLGRSFCCPLIFIFKAVSFATFSVSVILGQSLRLLKTVSIFSPSLGFIHAKEVCSYCCHWLRGHEPRMGNAAFSTSMCMPSLIVELVVHILLSTHLIPCDIFFRSIQSSSLVGGNKRQQLESCHHKLQMTAEKRIWKKHLANKIYGLGSIERPDADQRPPSQNIKHLVQKWCDLGLTFRVVFNLEILVHMSSLKL